MTFAVVPACGSSTRMGRAKLALPLHGRTVIEHVVMALREGGVEHVLVVVGPHVSELITLAASAGAEVLALTERTTDMRETVERGLAWIEERYHPQPSDWWVLTPADHPAFSSGTVHQLFAATETNPLRDVIVPLFDGRRGHPVMLRWNCVPGIRSLPEGTGINLYLRQRTAETLGLQVSDPGVLADLDTPEDYIGHANQNSPARRSSPAE